METAIVETLPCPMCGERAAIEVRTAGFAAWMQGALIQDAFPELDQHQRELLMTGTHEHCWEQMWAGMDDGDLRSCDGCGKVEDAGAAPDQDGAGRCVDCSEEVA